MKIQKVRDLKHKKIFKCKFTLYDTVTLICEDENFYLPIMTYTKDYFNKLLVDKKLIIVK
jgi:hypothetical protein